MKTSIFRIILLMVSISLALSTSCYSAVNVDPNVWHQKHDKDYTDNINGFSFSEGDVKISGHINGFDHDNFESYISLLIYDLITGEPQLTDIAIDENGDFSTSVSLKSVNHCLLRTHGNTTKTLYLEPGKTLDLLIDYSPKLHDSAEDPEFDFGGELGIINEQIHKAPSFQKFIPNCTLEEALQTVKKVKEKNLNLLESYKSNNSLEPRVVKLLEGEVEARSIFALLDYTYNYHQRVIQEKMAKGNLTPTDFVDIDQPLEFLDYIFEGFDKYGEWILISSDITLLLNRLFISSVFVPLGVKHFKPCLVFDPGFLFLSEKGIAMSPEDNKWNNWVKENEGKVVNIDIEESFELENALGKIDQLAEENGLSEELANYLDSKDGSFKFLLDEATTRLQEKKMDALRKYKNFETLPLIWQIYCSYILCSCSGITPDYSKENIDAQINLLETQQCILNPEILINVEKYLNDLLTKHSYYLPDTPDGKAVGKLIEPYAGKILLIDIWGTFCGPCRQAIEGSANLRIANRDNPDFKLMYVTSQDISPKDQYLDYVKKHLEGETSLYLSTKEFAPIDRIFQCSSFPRYILVGRDGKILNDIFDFYKLSSTLNRLGIELKY